MVRHRWIGRGGPEARAWPRHALVLPGRRERGVTLLVVMVLLLILGLSAAVVLRGAVSGERFAHNLRQQHLAQQQAELALRHCETELRKPDGSEAGLVPGTVLRDPRLAEAALTRTAWDAPPAWRLGANWAGPGGAASARITLPSELASGSGVGLAPGRLPECLVELQELADGALVHVITARGFSPAYRSGQAADSGTGPMAGAVVWLQSILLLGAMPPAQDASAGRRPVLDRLWRRVLQPP